MKKNFKKSKFVILPALATLVLTGVASVTGTVAWFTANRNASASLTSFKAETMDAALNVVAVTGVGTTKNAQAGAVAIDGALTHGSYDAKVKPLDDEGGHLYVANIDNDGTNDVITGYSDLGNLKNEATGTVTTTHRWQAGTKDGSAVWYGVSWTLKFSQVNNNSTKEDNVLLFNPTGTSFTGNGETINGLRIALMTVNKVLVVGGDDTTTHIDDSVTKDTETASLPKFSNYVKAGTSSTKAVDYDDLKKNNYLLGTIPSDDKQTLDLTVVAWFEGTDENVANNKTLTTNATAGLSFYSIKQAKSA